MVGAFDSYVQDAQEQAMRDKYNIYCADFNDTDVAKPLSFEEFSMDEIQKKGPQREKRCS